VLTYRYLPETAPPVSAAVAPAPGHGAAKRALAGYLLPLRDRRFMMLLAAFTLVLGLEFQRSSGYVAVHIARAVPRQHVLPLVPWLPKLTGIEILGLVQAFNTAAVALLALLMKHFLRGLSDRARVTLGVVLFTGSCVVLAVSTVAWVLLLAVLVLTLGELLHIPVMQTVLAGAVPEGARTRYMAVFNLNVRGGMVIAALSLSAGALLSAWGMAIVYALIGLCSCLLYWSLLTADRAAGRAASDPGPSERVRRELAGSRERESEGAMS
jgi:DHA1 family multidrug resistance protein B-like MFS transporter